MYVLSNPFWYFVLFCSVFNCYFDFSEQHFIKDNNDKKSYGRRNETSTPTSTSPQATRARSLFWASREKSRECEGQGERRALSLAG